MSDGNLMIPARSADHRNNDRKFQNYRISKCKRFGFWREWYDWCRYHDKVNETAYMISINELKKSSYEDKPR